MRTLLAVAAALGIAPGLIGCFSAPVPEEFIPIVDPPPAPSVTLSDVVRMSGAGLSDQTVIGMIRVRGLSDRPRQVDLAALRSGGVSEPVMLAVLASPVVEPPTARESVIQDRETWLPLWPACSRGRWHLGIRIAACFREAADGSLEPLPEPPPPEPPAMIEP